MVVCVCVVSWIVRLFFLFWVGFALVILFFSLLKALTTVVLTAVRLLTVNFLLVFIMRLSTLVGATCFYVILFGMILNLAPSFWRHILVWFYNPVTLIVVYIGKYAYQDHALEVAVSKEWFTVGKLLRFLGAPCKTPLHTAAKVGTAND